MIVAHWVQNPYYHAFCGEAEFQWVFLCDLSDLVYSRKRIGECGCEIILVACITIHGEKALEEEVCTDTTMQEKNITFPTEAKLYRKISLVSKIYGLKEALAVYLKHNNETAGLVYYTVNTHPNDIENELSVNERS